MEKTIIFLELRVFKKIAEDAFVEWEEVYKNQFYGTLKSEINRIWDLNKIAIFDVDVVGGLNLESMYGKNCLAIFIMPPSFDVLRGRLIKRGSESDKSLNIRLDNAKKEMLRKDEFDKIIINDEFNLACMQTKKL